MRLSYQGGLLLGDPPKRIVERYPVKKSIVSDSTAVMDSMPTWTEPHERTAPYRCAVCRCGAGSDCALMVIDGY